MISGIKAEVCHTGGGALPGVLSDKYRKVEHVRNTIFHSRTAIAVFVSLCLLTGSCRQEPQAEDSGQGGNTLEAETQHDLRTVEFTYRLTLKNITEDAKTVMAWVPLPANTGTRASKTVDTSFRFRNL
mgnify:CR=1